jgi:HK97 family phage major capsid protein
MNRIEKLKEKKAQAVERMRALLDLAESETRDLTEAEDTEYKSLDASLAKIDKDIEREERLAEQEAAMSKPAKSVRLSTKAQKTDPKEFVDLRDFLLSVVSRRDDPRLYDLYEEREQSMGTGTKGGFMVPEQFRPGLLAIDPQAAIFRPRAQVIPAGSPPDSAISMAALNQGAAKNMYGGVAVQWIAEAATKPETDMELRQIKLEPKEVAAHLVLTDKLLRNWTASASVCERQLRLAITAAEENAFYSGNGVGRPLGITASPARINYARTTANQIAYADVVGMFARLKMGGNPVWIASQTTIPQLATMVDNATGSNAVWMQSAVPGMPPTLLGIPVLFHERSVALGTAGDLILADLGYYLIKDGSGPFVAMSEHVYFTTNRSVLKIFWNVDGQPWLDAPIPLEGSAANTVSPFIVLN